MYKRCGTGERSGHFPSDMAGFSHPHDRHFSGTQLNTAGQREMLVDMMIEAPRAFTFNFGTSLPAC